MARLGGGASSFPPSEFVEVGNVIACVFAYLNATPAHASIETTPATASARPDLDHHFSVEGVTANGNWKADASLA